MQHNQEANPPDFDYAFNLNYRKKFTDAVPLATMIRIVLDEETSYRAMTGSNFEIPWKEFLYVSDKYNNGNSHLREQYTWQEKNILKPP